MSGSCMSDLTASKRMSDSTGHVGLMVMCSRRSRSNGFAQLRPGHLRKWEKSSCGWSHDGHLALEVVW